MAANLTKTETITLQALRLAAEADGATGHTYQQVNAAYRQLARRNPSGRLADALCKLEARGLVRTLTIEGMGGASRTYHLTD